MAAARQPSLFENAPEVEAFAATIRGLPINVPGPVTDVTSFLS